MGHKRGLVLSCMAALTPQMAGAWGTTGHRIVGEIAQRHVRRSTLRKIRQLLGADSLARVSTWADEMRSDPARAFMSPWHYVTIEDGATYENSAHNPSGDIVSAIARAEATLKDHSASKASRAEALKLLVHLMGDIHQPLHVGRGDDHGGNGVRVRFFGQSANLHEVWDEGLIDHEHLSFTEFASFIDHASAAEIAAWQKAPISEWMNESMELRPLVYGLSVVKGKESDTLPSISYDYRFKVMPTLERRLLQAGIRLAGRLDALLK